MVQQRRFLLGVDIGGTFTDFILVDPQTGRLRVEKCLTTVANPEEAVLTGVDRLTGGAPDALALTRSVIHATTLATNVVIERKGLPTALLTTAGFTDVLEIGRGYRYDLYDLFIRRPQPLIPRPLRLGVSERVGANGRILTPLAEEDVRAAAMKMRAAGVKAVAVCYLHSYRNPAHELRTAEILAEAMPDAVVSLSHQVIAEPKEFERSSTTAVDAYVKPTIVTYLRRLAERLRERGYDDEILVMLSNGGTATAETAKRFPVQMLESGPAAGVEAATFFGRSLGMRDLIAFDMGGTTAKICLVQEGRASRTRTFEIHHVHRFKAGSGLPVSLPVYDLLEIGAGGGSIARLDSLGLLQIGPESASADPGPACYGAGGTDATVTDADVVLGYLDADNFLGGEMKLDADAAGRAIQHSVADRLGLSMVEAAWGIHDLVNENMAAAAAVHVAERGQDTSQLAIVAFGGAGPIHALGVARKLGCPRLVIPPRPGVLSAFGLLVAPVSFERSRAVRQRLEEIDVAAIRRIKEEMTEEIRTLLPGDAGEAEAKLVLELWYVGQDYPVEVDMPPEVWDLADAVERVRAGFEAAYRRLYGSIDDMPIELVNMRVQLLLPPAPVETRWEPVGKNSRLGERPIWLGEAGAFAAAEVHDRQALKAGDRIIGPAVIVERESTTVIGDGDVLTVDGSGCLLIDLRASAALRAGSVPQSALVLT